MSEELTALAAIQTSLNQIRETADGGYNRETDSLEAIRDAINAISLGAGTATSANQELIKDGNAADFVATEDSLHDLRSAIGRTIITGAANRALESTPYYLGSDLQIIRAPTVDQPAMVVAYQSLANVNGALPTTAEITPGTVNVDRFRDGTDADWVSIVAAAALTEANGIVRYPYAFPAASWQVGDLARVQFTGTSVVFGGKTVTLPDAFGFTLISGLVTADSAGTTFPEYVIGNKADAAQTDGGATRSVIAHVKGVLSLLNNATFGLSALETRLDGIEGAGFATGVDSLKILSDNLDTANTNINTVLTRLGAPGVSINADIATLLGYHTVPAQDAATNSQMRDVIGQKTDTTITDATAFTGTSLSRKALTLQRTWKAVIPDTDVSLAAIDNAVTTIPNGSNTPDVANTILTLNLVAGSSYRLENIILQVTSFGTGTYVDIRLYIPINGTVTNVKTVRVGAAPSATVDYSLNEYLNLGDMFGVSQITADSIHLIVLTDAGNTGALVATANYSIARSS